MDALISIPEMARRIGRSHTMVRERVAAARLAPVARGRFDEPLYRVRDLAVVTLPRMRGVEQAGTRRVKLCTAPECANIHNTAAELCPYCAARAAKSSRRASTLAEADAMARAAEGDGPCY